MNDDHSTPLVAGAGEPRTGFLVLADISGFTAFVTATELEHGPPLVAELLEQVIRAISPPLEVDGVEGDAVFALGLDGRIDPPARLLDVLDAGFRGFRTKQRELAADDSCSCGACCSVGKLSLKAVGHYGTFVEQTIGGRTLTAGRDVVLAHRLLKNGLRPEVDYALFTRSALERMNVQPERIGLLRHTERFEHFGDVECFVGAVGGG